jgi:hypothetical protein
MTRASTPVDDTDLRPGSLWSAYIDELRPEFSRDRLLRFGIITLEFALIVWAMAALRIEAASVDRVLLLALCGFVVNHFLPMAWREPFFAALSVSSLFLVFGAGHGLWLFALGSVLIALCHVPLPFPARVGLIVAVGTVLAIDRGRFVTWQSPVPTAIWAILGSMFMFRLVVYLYDLKHRTARFSVASAFAYFFMIPNVCLPLFPVVDYKTFQRSRYNADALKIYQTGVRWMIRGVIHLLLYKFVYLELVIAPGEVVNGSTAAQYIFSTLLLYLKVSGLFHLVVGVLHMFGYGLPETHHLYFFSSSYADLWRRINIYWKDFIQKVFFNPLYFAMRKYGDMRALVISTMLAFTATWFFHSYQWFWIRGEFPLPWTDIVFWFGLGFILTINAVVEARWGRKRMLAGDRLKAGETVVLALKIAATFGSLAMLWAIWSTPDSGELRAVAAGLLNSGPRDLALLLGIPLSVGVAGAIVGSRQRVAPRIKTPGLFWREVPVVGVLAVALIIVGLRPGLLEPVSPGASAFFKEVSARSLNAIDRAQMVRGYYEDIGDVTRFNSELWTIYNTMPEGWDNDKATRKRADTLEWDLIPLSAGQLKGAWRTINSHGMRDREYDVVPPPDVFRIALVGSSNDYGSGVEDDQTYENVVETRLNRDLAPVSGKKYEILNFSVGGASSTRKLAIIEERVFAFHPDLVLFVLARNEFDRLAVSAINLKELGLLDQFPFLKTAMQRAGIPTAQGDDAPIKKVAKEMLAPYGGAALLAALERFRDEAIERGVRPAILLTEVPDDSPAAPEELDKVESIARSSGLPVVSLRGAFDSFDDRKSLWVAPWDAHANAEGHRKIAEQLYPTLLQSGLIPVQEGSGDSSQRLSH